MQQQAPGNNLTLKAKTKVVSGVPILYGERLVIPSVSVAAGRFFAAEKRGTFTHFDDMLADGVTPDYTGEKAYYILEDEKLTTAKTTNNKANVHVGYFVTNFDEPAFDLGV